LLCSSDPATVDLKFHLRVNEVLDKENYQLRQLLESSQLSVPEHIIQQPSDIMNPNGKRPMIDPRLWVCISMSSNDDPRSVGDRKQILVRYPSSLQLVPIGSPFRQAK